jgi:hypothetical protein
MRDRQFTLPIRTNGALCPVSSRNLRGHLPQRHTNHLPTAGTLHKGNQANVVRVRARLELRLKLLAEFTSHFQLTQLGQLLHTATPVNTRPAFSPCKT